MKSTSERKERILRALTLVGVNMIALLGVAGIASASPVSDVPDGLNDALFGGANLFAAQAILTAAVMASMGLVLAMLRLNYIATFIVLLAILGALTAMGWADPSLLLISGLLIVAFFSQKIATYFVGNKEVKE